MVSVSVRNCIRYYQTAEEIGAILLRDYCSQLISSHWVSDKLYFTAAPNDFYVMRNFLNACQMPRTRRW